MSSKERKEALDTLWTIESVMVRVRDPMVREMAAYTCIWGSIDPNGNRDKIDMRISLLRELIGRADKTCDYEGPVARTPRYHRE